MRRIKKAKIQFISLVPAGANKLQPVYKSDDNSVSFGTLVKAGEDFDELGELTAVVYAPEHRDSQGDIADAAVVKQMAHDFITEGAGIDIKHDGKAVTADRARVGETFIVHKSDDRFHGWTDRDGAAIDLTGAWATVIKIDDPKLREKFRNGEWAGVSMGGTAIVEQEKAASIDDLVAALTKAMAPPAQTPIPKDSDMTPEQFEALKKTMADGFASLAKQPEAKPAEQTPAPAPAKEDKEPVFKGSYDDEAALIKHARAVQIFELRKEVDFSSPESVKEFIATQRELKKEWAEEDKQDKPVRKAGPAQGSDENPNNVPDFLRALPVAKADKEAMASAAALADSINKERFGG